MYIVIPIVAVFLSILVILYLIDPKLEKKVKAALVLTILMVPVSVIGNYLGLLGALVAAILSIILIMKILGYSFLRAFIFQIAVGIIYSLILFGVEKIFL